MKSRAVAVREEYRRLAGRYDRRYAAYIEASVQATLARLSVGPRERVLDVGCGTGVLLQRLIDAQPEAVLTGVDPSPEMLQRARSKLSSEVSLHESHSEQLSFEDAVFDLIVSTSALHYFFEPARGLAEMVRILAPGGRLVITDWCADFFSSRLRERLLRLCGYGHFRTFRSAELKALLADAGFLDVKIECYKIHWHWGLMTARARVGNTPAP